MAMGAESSEPEDADDVAEVHQTGGRLAAQCPQHAPIPGTTFRRHPPKVGAQCGSPARWDLCGGRGAILVPTAISVPPTTIGRIRGRGSTGRMGAAAGGARSQVVIGLAPVEPAAYASRAQPQDPSPRWVGPATILPL